MGKKIVKVTLIILTTILFIPSIYAADDFGDFDEEFGAEQELKEINKKEKSRNSIGRLKKVENIGNGHKDNKVIVEPRNIIPVTSTGKMEMVPYRMRRTKWGQVWGLSYGLYNPTDYKIDQLPEGFSEYYPVPSLGLLSVEFILKRNFDYLTMGLIGSAGYFKSESDVTGFDAELMIVPLKLGFILELETLWREPWVVPYAWRNILHLL